MRNRLANGIYSNIKVISMDTEDSDSWKYNYPNACSQKLRLGPPQISIQLNKMLEIAFIVLEMQHSANI